MPCFVPSGRGMFPNGKRNMLHRCADEGWHPALFHEGASCRSKLPASRTTREAPVVRKDACRSLCVPGLEDEPAC